MTGLRFLLTPLLIAFFFLSDASLARSAPDVELMRANAMMATDGSVRIALDFNGPAPDARSYRSHDKLLHIVLVGAHFRKRAELADIRLGEVSRGRFALFAGIGMRLDLAVNDDVAVRTESIGKTVIVHIPARYSDRETAFMPIVAPAPAQPKVQAPQAVAGTPHADAGAPHAAGGAPHADAGAAHAAAGPPHAAVAALPAPGNITVFIPLSYADVSEVAGALVKGAVVPANDVFAATSPFASLTAPAAATSGQSTPPSYVSIPAATLLPKDTPQGVRFDDHVAVDRRLNAIILTGTQDIIDADRKLIAAMDTPTRSVLLETQIVELTTTAAHDIGIDYAPNGTAFGSGSFSASSFNYLKVGLSVAATIAALEQSGQAKILARPRIIAVNNRPAAILSGEAVPIFNSVIIPGGTGTVVQNQIQYINVGVSLQIIPRIASDGRVTSQIFCEVSSIIDYVGTTPRIAVRQELTTAVVDDAESLIVGGLLQETEIRNLKKVPSLGNLPLIGQFFRDSSGHSQSTNLYIVITPHILTDGPRGNAEATPSVPLALPTIPPPNSTPGQAGEPLKPEVAPR